MCSLDTFVVFFFQAEAGIRDLVRSRGLGDVYKRQALWRDGLLARIDLEPPGHDDSRLMAQVDEFVETLSLIHI